MKGKLFNKKIIAILFVTLMLFSSAAVLASSAQSSSNSPTSISLPNIPATSSDSSSSLLNTSLSSSGSNVTAYLYHPSKPCDASDENISLSSRTIYYNNIETNTLNIHLYLRGDVDSSTDIDVLIHYNGNIYNWSTIPITEGYYWYNTTITLPHSIESQDFNSLSEFYIQFPSFGYGYGDPSDGNVTFYVVKIYTISPRPTVTISTPQDAYDADQQAQFSIASSEPISSYGWYRNQTLVSNESSLSYPFPSSGDYSITAVIKSNSGWVIHSNTLNISVSPKLSLSIVSSANPADVEQEIEFSTGTSGGTGTYIAYHFSVCRDSSSIYSGDSHYFDYTFSDPGIYLIKYSVEDSNNNTIYKEFNETINSNPQVSIVSSQNPTDAGDSITFTATTTDGTPPDTYQWYVNDVAISGATSSIYTTSFSSSGTYDVYVVIQDSVGKSVTSSTISEIVNNDPSVSIKSSQPTTDIGNSVTFTATGTDGTGSYSFAWYKDGTLESSTSSTYTTSFTSPGSHTIEVIITDSLGNKAYYNYTEKVNSDPSVSISSSQNPTDAGNSVTFTATGSYGTGSYSYQWYHGNGTAISGATSSTYTTSYSSSGSYSVYVILTDADGDTATSNTITETVYSDPSVSITSSQNPTDVGNSVTFTASPSGGSGSYTYQWYRNGNAVSGATSSTYTTSFSSSGSDSIYVIIHDSVGNSAQSSTITETVNSDPSVTISSSQNPTDIGNTVTFTASGSGGTGSYTYQWYEGSSAISGATSSTYSTPFNSAGTYSLYVIIHDGVGNSATSNTITETVYSDPSVSVSSSQNPTDVGNSVTFTASPSGGSGSYSYQWYRNGNAVSGATSSTYTTSFSSSGSDSIYVIIHDSVGNSAQSSTITETVYSDPSVSVSSSQNPTDVGNSVTFTASPSGGSENYSFQWYYGNGTAISGAISSTYKTSYSSSGTKEIYVIIHDSVGNSAQSSTFDETVNSDPSVSITSSQNPTDVGNSVTFTASPSGGSGDYSYQWYRNGNAVSGATSSTYITSFSSSGSDSIYVIIKDGVGNSATSSTITETVNADPSVTISSSQNPTDIGNTVTFTASPSGGSGSYSYQWYANGTAISGATSSTYTTPYSSAGSYSVYVIITDGVGNSATSNTITETVYSDPSVTISSSQNPTDVGNSVTFTAFPTGGSGSYSYQWYRNGNAVSGATSSTYKASYSTSGTYEVYVIIHDSVGNSATSSIVDETVNNDPIVTITSTQNPTDAGNSVTFTATGSYGTGSYSYQWYSNGTVISGATSSTYSASFSAGSYSIYVVLTDGVGDNATSNTITQTVNSDPTVTISSSQNPTDSGNDVTFTATGSYGTGSYSFAWYKDGTLESSTSSTYTTSFTSPGSHTIEVIITDSLGNKAYYNYTETVNMPLSVSISSSQNPTEANVTVRFTSTVTGGVGTDSYAWYDNNVEVSTNSSFNFNSSVPGSFNISLILKDSDGSISDSNVIDEIVVHDPVISVTYSITPLVSESVTIFAHITGGLGGNTLKWTFNTGTATGMNVTYAFSHGGDRTYSIKITDSTGYTNTQEFTVYVHLKVTISATPLQGAAPLKVSFEAETLGGSSYIYEWNFGDGNISASEDTTNVFSAGNYTVSLVVTDASGVNGTASIVIHSYPQPVTLVYSNNENITYKFVFQAIPSWDIKAPYNASWSFPNGQVFYGMNISYVFPIYSASNTIYVTITYNSTSPYGGDSYSTSIIVHMKPAKIKVVFTPPSYIPTGTMLDMNASASAPDSNSFTFSWLINGASYSGNNTNYYFSSAGKYYVNLTVTDSLGATTSISRSITVQSPGSASSIRISISTKTAGSYYYYTITVNSIKNISNVEAFLSSTMLPIKEISGNNTHQVYNLTLNQRNYNSGTFTITAIAYNVDGSSNSQTADFSVTSKYSSSSSLNIVQFFGGIGNTLEIFVSLTSIIAGYLYFRKRGTTVIQEPGGYEEVGRPGKPLILEKKGKK